MVTEHQVKALAAEGAQKSVEIVTKSHLSLTGASGKVGLYYHEAGSRWYLPEGTAPSTHIVKQSHVRLEGNNGDGFVSVPMFHFYLVLIDE